MSDEQKTTEQPEIPDTHDEIETRDRIFKAKDCREVLVEIPEWGVKILLCALTGTARANYYAFHNALMKEHAKDGTGDGAFIKRNYFEQVRLSAFHPRTRKPIFKEADRDTLMDEHNGAVIEDLAAMVREISDLGRSSTEEAKKKLQSIQKPTATTSLQSASISGM